MIEVAAAILHRDGKLLVCQRPKGKGCEFLWEFPGGKLEPGETPEECIVRECREELGATIEPKRLLRQMEHVYPELTVNMHFLLCSLVSGEPSCLEHNDIKWLTLDEIKNLPLCPADKKMLGIMADDILQEAAHDRRNT